MPQPMEFEKYTYADYCTWDDSERWEIIDGVAYAMAPAPSPGHQGVSIELGRQLANFLKGKPCRVFSAPFDVRLNAENDDDTVVQPDLVVICDKSKINDKGCNGTPDLIVEILSPSSARHDKVTKLNKYRDSGVREYWIVDPADKSLQAIGFEKGYIRGYADTDIAPVAVLPGCEISLTDVFAE